jgi:NAD(P)H-flavin reductase
MDTLTMYIAILVGMLILYFARRTAPRNLAVPEGPLKGEKEFMPFRLIKKTDISPDTKIFTFHIEGNQCLGLPIGQHIILRANIPTPEVPEGKQFTRKYTPISTLNQAGTFDLLIKIYYKNVHPKFPEGGKMSQYVDSL